jgi:hypothetical protein
MERLVLFITRLQEIFRRNAALIGVLAPRILYVWMVASLSYLPRTGPAVTGISETGVRFRLLGQEPVPNLEEFLAPMRGITAWRITPISPGASPNCREIRLAGFAELDAASGKARMETSEGVAAPAHQ